MRYIEDEGYYNITGGCEAVADLPDLTFVLDGEPYSIPNYLWTQKVGRIIPLPPCTLWGSLKCVCMWVC